MNRVFNANAFAIAIWWVIIPSHSGWTPPGFVFKGAIHGTIGIEMAERNAAIVSAKPLSHLRKIKWVESPCKPAKLAISFSHDYPWGNGENCFEETSCKSICIY